MARITIGVDTGKGTHQAAAYDPAADRMLGHVRFTADRAGFERFQAFLTGLSVETDGVLVGVEATGHYHLTLVEFLLGLGYPVATVNAYQAAQFRRSQGKRAKTDRIDARALARFLAVGTPTPMTPPDEVLACLRELTRFRADLVAQRTTALNRLHGALDIAFPELLGVLKHLGSPTVLAVLEQYPTASAVARANPYELAALLRAASQGQVRAAAAKALLAAAATSIAVRRLEAALTLRVRSLVRQITTLNAEIAELEAAISRDFARLGRRPSEFPAGGVVALATILAEAGDIARFPSARQFLAHFGWCPADTQSGQYKDAHPRLSKAGNRFVRRIIFLLAVGAVRHPGPYRTYFEQRTAAGKNKMDTLVAIGRKILTTIYAILKTGRPYDPMYRPHAHPLAAAA